MKFVKLMLLVTAVLTVTLASVAEGDWCHMPYEQHMVTNELMLVQQHVQAAGYYGNDLEELKLAKYRLELALEIIEDGILQHQPCPDVTEENDYEPNNSLLKMRRDFRL